MELIIIFLNRIGILEFERKGEVDINFFFVNNYIFNSKNKNKNKNKNKILMNKCPLLNKNKNKNNIYIIYI